MEAVCRECGTGACGWQLSGVWRWAALLLWVLSVGLVGMAKRAGHRRKAKGAQKNRIDDTEDPMQGATAGMYPISTGEAELVPDGYHADGWLLLVNGVQSSHVIVGEPRQLDFGTCAGLLRSSPSHVEEHLDAAKLRITHLGGGACSMARYFADLYPTSRNTVVELDAKLASMCGPGSTFPRHRA